MYNIYNMRQWTKTNWIVPQVHRLEYVLENLTVCSKISQYLFEIIPTYIFTYGVKENPLDNFQNRTP